MGNAEYPELGELYLELAEDYGNAATFLLTSISQLVDDTFTDDPRLVDAKSRQKELESVAQKAIARGWDTEQVRTQMTDLIGVRLICMHLSQIEDLRRLLRELDHRSVIHIKKEQDWIEDPQDSGYRGVHVDVDIKLQKQKRDRVEVVDIPCEIQIRTLIQHSWSERAHGLIHKPDYRPSDRIKNLFWIESYRLHGHQKTMDALWEMALWERKVQETEESINPLSLKGLAEEFGVTLSDKTAMDLYRNIRAVAPLKRIEESRGVLSDESIQEAIGHVYRAELNREPDLTGKLVYGSLISANPDDGVTLCELDVLSSPEFRGKDILPFNFNVIGRVEHSFASHLDRGGGWFAYHRTDCVGVVRGCLDGNGDADGVEITSAKEGQIFRAAYPVFSLAYPGQAIRATLRLEGKSHFFVLATATNGQRIFFEYGAEYQETSEIQDDSDGTIYVRNPVKVAGPTHSIESNLPVVLEAVLPNLRIHLVHGFYCEANPRLVLKMAEVHKTPFLGP